MAADVFSWLHLTDLHFGLGGQKYLWPNLREPFLNDLDELHDRCGPWDAVFFTGDLTQQGTSAEFAEMQSKVLDRLWVKLTELGSRDAVLLAVPGNHDLIRPDLKREDNPAAKHLIENPFDEVADRFWDPPTEDYHKVIDQAFAAYTQWWQGAPCRPADLTPGLLPGDFAVTLDRRGHKIGVVGLNTAFLQLAGGDYTERLIWDVRQLDAVCSGDAGDWTKKHDLCLLLTHHGPDWLTPAARKHGDTEIAPPGRFALHLFGHMHATDMLTQHRGGDLRAVRRWQGLSLFGMEYYGDQLTQRRDHGFTAGRIDFSSEPPTARCWPRRATNKTGGWRLIPDEEAAVLANDGATHPEPVILTLPRRRAAPAAVPAAPAPLPAALEKFVGRVELPVAERTQMDTSAPRPMPRGPAPQRPLTRRWQIRARFMEEAEEHQRSQTEYKTEELEQFDTVVMLGEPGAGKTFELDHLASWAAQDHLARRRIKLNTMRSDADLLSPLQDDARRCSEQTKLTVYLDALDEDRTETGQLIAIVQNSLDAIRAQLPGRLRLRLTCRTTRWSDDLERSLRSVVGGELHVVELLDLNDEEALALAGSRMRTQRIKDPEQTARARLHALAERELASLATRPITLRMVCDYKEALPDSRIKLFRDILQQHATEHDPDARGPARRAVDPAQALRIAANLAALMTFSTWKVIPLRGRVDDLSVGQLAQHLNVTEADVQAVACSALFAEGERGPSGPTREISQQSFADFLVAWWLAHDAPDAWAQLLFYGDELSLRVEAVAAWLAYLDDAVWRRVLSVRPELLLTPDLPTASAHQRAELLDVLLKDPSFDRVMLVFSRRALLSLVGAEDRLLQHLGHARDAELSHTVLRVLETAAGTTLRDLERRSPGSAEARVLVEALVQNVLAGTRRRGHTSGAWASGALAHGLGIQQFDAKEFVDRERRRWWDDVVAPLKDTLDDARSLSPLPERAHEERADCHADVMNLLYPRVIDLDDLIRALYPPREAYLGGYAIWWDQGLTKISECDHELLERLIPVWGERPNRTLEGNGTAQQRWSLIYNNLHIPGVWDRYVELMHRLLHDDREFSALPLSTDARRRLLTALIDTDRARGRGRSGRDDVLANLFNAVQLFSEKEDLFWWIDQLATADDVGRSVYVALVRKFYNYTRRPGDELVTALRARWPSLSRGQQDALSELRFLLTDEAMAQAAAKNEAELRALKAKSATRSAAKKIPATKRFTELLEKNEGASKDWLRIAHELYDLDDLGTWGMQRSYAAPPMWHDLTPAQHTAIEARAMRFLTAVSPTNAEQATGTPSFTWDDVGLLGALRLLLFLRRDDDTLSDLGLSPATWERLAPSVLLLARNLLSGWLPNEPRLYEALIHRLRLHAPQAWQQLQPLMNIGTDENDATKLVDVLLLGPPSVVDPMLRHVLKIPQMTVAVESALLPRLTHRGDRVGNGALQLALRRLREGRAQDEALWRSAGRAALRSPDLADADWPLVLDWMNDPDNLREARTTVAPQGEPLDALNVGRLGQVIERVYEQLPPPSPDATPVTPGDGLRVTLGSLDALERPEFLLDKLMRRGTPEALQELERLHQLFPLDELTVRVATLRDTLNRQREHRFPPLHILAQRRHDS